MDAGAAGAKWDGGALSRPVQYLWLHLPA